MIVVFITIRHVDLNMAAPINGQPTPCGINQLLLDYWYDRSLDCMWVFITFII